MRQLWTSIDIKWRVVLIVLFVMVLSATWYLGSPLFINKIVNESFPAVTVPAGSQEANALSEAAEMEADSDEAFPAESTEMMSESNEMTSDSDEASAAESATEMTSDSEERMSESDEAAGAEPTEMTSEPDEMAAPSSESDAAEPAGPIALRSGEFGDIDAVHKGEGTAALYELQDGRRVLRLDDFKVTNGPDLYVYLSADPAPRDSDELHEGKAFEVAKLKGNIGNQNYELPADLDLSGFNSVVIYCKPFRVIFSTAELSGSS